jgi:ribosomal protein S18 acetylase RimI-like enzyme
MAIRIRRATVEDAAAIATVLNGVIAEGNLTAFDQPFSVEQERQFITALGVTSALHVAEEKGTILGVQSVDRLSHWAASMSHVATMGTWLTPEARGRGIGRMLFTESVAFARASSYTKIVIQVLAINSRALGFYRRLGFTDIGVAKRHVRLAGALHDEIYLELLLE